jgi:hypothetical protein
MSSGASSIATPAPMPPPPLSSVGQPTTTNPNTGTATNTAIAGIAVKALCFFCRKLLHKFTSYKKRYAKFFGQNFVNIYEKNT